MSSLQFKDEQDEREKFTLDKEGEWKPMTEEKKITDKRINPEDRED